MEMFTRGGKVVVEGIPDSDNIHIIIPSQLFPLTGGPDLFHAGNTEICTDHQLQEIFDNTEAHLGFCYSNIENLLSNLKKAGIPKQRYRPYVGWLFIGEQMPIHHAFLVVDNKHLLDFSASRIYEDLEQQNIESLLKDELRDKVAEEFIKDQSKPHSQRATFGQANKSFIYVASQCKPNYGRIQYNKLIRSYPNHPCIRGTGPLGITDMQQRIFIKAQQKKGV